MKLGRAQRPGANTGFHHPRAQPPRFIYAIQTQLCPHHWAFLGEPEAGHPPMRQPGVPCEGRLLFSVGRNIYFIILLVPPCCAPASSKLISKLNLHQWGRSRFLSGITILQVCGKIKSAVLSKKSYSWGRQVPVTVFINNIVYHLNERKFKGLMISFSPIHAVQCQLRQWRKTNLFYLCSALMVVLQTL